MQLKILTTPEAFDTLGDQWNTLLQQAATNTLFLTREWQRVWWKHLGDGDLRILTLHDGDQLVGIAPLFIEQDALGAGQVQFVGCKEVSDYLDFIFLKGRERECFEAVLDYLAGDDVPQWTGISLCNIPETSPTLTALSELASARGWKVSQIFEDVCPIIALPGTFEAYLGTLDGKERRELQRKLRRSDEDATVTYTHDAATLEADMADFLRLMRASMMSKEDFMTPRMETFFRAMAKDMLEAGYLQLAFLEVNGDRAATYLNFVWQDQVLVYNSGLDPQKFSYLSPGQVLVAKLIEKAIAEHRSTFDFLQGNEEYKHKLGGKDVKLFTLGIAR